MGEPQRHFGTILRERRIAKGYSLRKFAEAIEVSPTYLSLVETGKSEYPPSAEKVRIMAELLGADPDQWAVLAGRMPEDVKEIILSEPEMPALLRAAKGLTADELRKLTAKLQQQKERRKD